MKKIPILFLSCNLLVFGTVIGGDAWDTVLHGFVDNNGVKLHYAALGEGPLVVMVHGYPDFWYTWRHQMDALSNTHQVVAMDLRGYNRSDKPEGVENYTITRLISDVVAVIQHFPQKEAVVIGHDWGGAIAWQTAIRHPELVTRLIVLSTPSEGVVSGNLHESGTAAKQSVRPGVSKGERTSGAYAGKAGGLGA